MGYSLFQFGTLYLDDIPEDVPKNPINEGDIRPYQSNHQLRIRDNTSFNSITWIKPNGMGVLIADRVLLSAMSWKDVERLNLFPGRTFNIFGREYLCRLLSKKEWDTALDATSSANSLWHWEDMGTLTSTASVNAKGTQQHTFVGRMTPNFFGAISDGMKSVNVGFRPILEPTRVRRSKAVSSCVLDGERFFMEQMPGEVNGFTPILTPALRPLFKQIPNGKVVKMYTLLYKEKPVHPNSKNNIVITAREAECIKLTDKYFGDEYLIPWIISNGVAIASKALAYISV